MAEAAPTATRKYVPPKWVKVLFARCEDCEKRYDLNCDTIVVADIEMARQNLDRFIQFLLEHSGHRMTFRAERVEEKVT